METVPGEYEEGGPREGRRMETERMDGGEAWAQRWPSHRAVAGVCVAMETCPDQARMIMGGQKGSTGVMGGEKVWEGGVRQVDKTRGHL